MMKKYIFPIVLSLLCLTACGQKAAEPTDQKTSATKTEVVQSESANEANDTDNEKNELQENYNIDGDTLAMLAYYDFYQEEGKPISRDKLSLFHKGKDYIIDQGTKETTATISIASSEVILKEEGTTTRQSIDDLMRSQYNTQDKKDKIRKYVLQARNQAQANDDKDGQNADNSSDS